MTTDPAEPSAFENTMVAVTLDAPIEPGKNVVWCASFQAAWKRLQNDIFEGPIRLIKAEALAEALNSAPDPVADIPHEWLYTAAGLTRDGIIETIQREMGQRFPDKDAPDFLGSVGFIAYAFLTAALKFPEPYLQNDEPLLFTGNSDRQTVISSFGIREKDDHRYLELRHQLRVLHTNLDEDAELLTPFVAREGQALYAASSGRAEAAEKRLEMDFDSGSMFGYPAYYFEGIERGIRLTPREKINLMCNFSGDHQII